MTGLIFLASGLAAPLVGSPFVRVAAGSIASRAGRFAFACGAGAVALTLSMLALSAAGIPWTPLRILAAGGLPGLLVLAARPAGRSGPDRPAAGALPGLAAAAAALLVFLYAAGTARATSMDYLYFWGTKGQDFAAARGIDVAFLAEPDHAPLHPDYPPLLPCLYALGAVAAGRFAWGAGMLSAPIFLALAAAAFWGTARRRLDDREAALWCALLAALLGFASIAAAVGGNAEPPLLFFETVALGILVFGERSAAADFAASIALAGGVLSKFEGAFFAVAVAGVFGLLRRGGIRDRFAGAARLIVFPALALAAWIAFCVRHGLLDDYRITTRGPLTFVHLSTVITSVARNVSYGAGYLPWIVLLAALAAGGLRKESIPPALVAGAISLVNVAYYLHGRDDPTDWIGWSASRTFLTPMLCLLFAAAAARSTETPDSPRSAILETPAPEA